jgi:UPF0716 protein FxsA
MPVFLLLLIVLIGVPVLEIYVVIQVGDAIGWLPTIALMLLDAAVGAALMRSQGRAVWRSFLTALREGRPPARELLDGVLVIAGGAFLVAPGFVTDLLGALLLFPPTRALARRRLARRLAGRVLGVVSMPMAGTWPRGPGSAAPPADVDGTAVDVDRPEIRG